MTRTATARRTRLAELEALTDQIGPLCDRIDALWRAIDAYEHAWRRAAANRRQVTP